MIAPLLMALAAASGQEGGRLVTGEVRLEGPLETVELDLGARGRTLLTCELLEGEQRTVLVPLPARSLGAPPPGLLPDDGRVRFLGHGPPSEELAHLPAGLRRRSRPAVGLARPRPDPIALLLLATSALVVLGTRRRALLSSTLGLLAAALVVAVQLRRPAPAPARVRVLEGHLEEDADSARWMLVEGAAGRLALDPARDLDLESEPARAALRYEGRLAATGATWSVLLERGRLWRLAPLDPGARRLAAGANLWGPLEQVWRRALDGGWSAHGPWSLGAPLPDPDPSLGAPPGWLIAGLPQGRGALVARLAPEAWDGGEGPGGHAALTWLRLVGADFVAGR